MAGISGVSNRSSINTIVEQYLNVERAPIEKIQTNRTSLNKKLTVLSELKQRLNSLKTRVKDLSDVETGSKIGTRTVTSSDTTIATAEATTSATLGTNTLFVKQLARRDTAVSDRFNSSATTLAEELAGKSLKFTVAVGDGSENTFTISVSDTTETNQSVLLRLRDTFNDADLGVTASVIRDTPTTHRLTLVSDDGGEENAITLSDRGFRELGFINGGSNRRAMNGTSGGFIVEDTSALNAQFQLNGIDIVSHSNTVEDVLPGVTIQLLKVQAEGEAPATLTVSQDTESVKETLQAFIDDYNSALSYLNEKTAGGAGTDRGELAGNYTLFNLRLKLRTLAISPVPSIESGTPRSLVDIGITAKRDGTLQISDTEQLEEALAADPTVVIQIFEAEDGLRGQFETLTERFTGVGQVLDDEARTINTRINELDKQSVRASSRLDQRELSLRRQFTSLQKVLTNLSAQQQLLNRFSSFSGLSFQLGGIEMPSINASFS